MYLANQDMNRVRNNYYGNNYTPHMFTSGKSSSSSTAKWKSDPLEQVGEMSLFKINISGTQNKDEISFEVRTSSVANTELNENIRLFIATVMGHVIYNNSANGLRDHHDAVIEIVTGNEGKKMEYISGVEYVESVSWSMPRNWVDHQQIKWKSEDLKVVAWIQDYSSKTVLQVNEYDFK